MKKNKNSQSSKGFQLKNILKAFKMNESTISMILGAFIIVIVGILVINYFKKSDEGTTIPGSNTTTEENNTVPTKGGTHIVKKGETLWSIAEDAYNSGYNWVDIARENKIANGNKIEVGQKLNIPDVKSKTPTVNKTKLSESKITGNTYTVVKGDSLWKIAVRAYGDGYKWVEIAKENHLANPNLIHQGNRLVIPK